MARTEERTRLTRDSFLSVQAPWWPMAFWLFIGQLSLEAAMVVLDERSRLPPMSLVEQARFIRSEITDDILISAVISIALVDIWRNILVTAEWLKGKIEKREERIRNEGREEGGTEMQERILGMLDEDTRKEIESELRRNGDSDSKD